MFSKSRHTVICAGMLVIFYSCHVNAAAEDLDAIATGLRTILEERFSENRNHAVNPTNKDNAVNLIKEDLEGYGLQVESMPFTGENNAYEGTNVIGVLPGKMRGAADDKVLVLGSHFDTVTSTPGVDDNGSGMAVFLETIRLVTKETCRLTNTIVFVAFDLEEFQPAAGHGLIGSDHFVSEWLVPFLANDDATNSTFQGAVVLETLMNFNATDHAQTLPAGFELVFPEQYQRIAARNFSGDFVTVVGRATDDAELMSGFSDQWNELSHDVFLDETVALPFSGVPTELDYQLYGDFFRSDHTSFWRHEPDSLKAIFLTDTANFRGNMAQCYHRDCDDLSTITDENMLFLAKTTRSVVNVLKEFGIDNPSDTCLSGGATVQYTYLMLSEALVLVALATGCRLSL